MNKISEISFFLFWIFILAFLFLFFPLTSFDSAYRIGLKDVLHLSIYAGGEKQREIEVVVSSKGTIGVPFLGDISAVGLEVNELAQQITQKLTGDYFIEPEVNLYVSEYHSLKFYIAGAVKSPGLFEMNEKPTLLELIAKAGGILPERGTVAYILRDSFEIFEDGKNVRHLIDHNAPFTVDLRMLLDKGDMTYNKTLETDDVVFIPFENDLDIADSKIYVDGEVKEPGLYRYQPGLTALAACLMAGGFTRFAAPNRTRIIRQEKEKELIIEADLNYVSKGKRPDIPLKSGDRIYVPESWL